MTKSHRTYHEIEGTERRIDKANELIKRFSNGMKIEKTNDRLLICCSDIEWSDLCNKLGIIEWKPRFGVY